MSESKEKPKYDIGHVITEYTISNDKPITHLFGRDKNLNRRHVRIYNKDPYLYVPENTIVPKNTRIKKVVKNNWKDIKGNKVKKVICKIPKDIGGDSRKGKTGIRDRFRITYEDDIPYTTRVNIDLGIKSGFRVENNDVEIDKDYFKQIDFKVKLRRLHYDIEVSTVEIQGRMPTYKNPICPIYSLSNFDNYSQKFIAFIWHYNYGNNRKFEQNFHVPIFDSLQSLIKIKKDRIRSLEKFIQTHKKPKEFKEDEELIDEYESQQFEEYYDNLTKDEKDWISYNAEIPELKRKVNDLLEKYKLYQSMFKKDYPVSIYTFDNEKDMLNKYIEYVRDIDPDIITGWNAKKFDTPYVIERMKKLNNKYYKLSPLNQCYVDGNDVAHVKGRIVFDTWQGYKKTVINELESYKLDNVAKTLFGIGKVQHQGIDWMWDNDRDLLLKYNIQDVFLEYAIGETENIFEFFYDVKSFVGCSYEDVLENSRIVDTYLLFKSKERRIVLPSKRNRPKEKYKGAVVVEPKLKGVQHWIAVIDLKSLYPMIMLSLNMGEDTIVLNPSKEEIPFLIKSPLHNVYFRKDKKSFLASILKELIDLRDIYKKLMFKARDKEDKHEEDINNRLQTVIKFITNSIYGVMGYSGFRLYNKNIALCITTVGRLVINYTINVCAKIGYKNYYGDTDSIFPYMKSTNLDDAIIEVSKLTDKVNKSYKIFLRAFNIEEHFFLMKPEKIFKTIIMVKKKGGDGIAKKKYAGIKVWEDGKKLEKIGIKGFDRSDMSRIGNTTMKKLLQMAIYEKSNSEIIEYVKGIINNIRKDKYPLEDLAWSKGIKRDLHTYGNQDWIRGARWTNTHSCLWDKQTNFGGGSKPKYVYVKSALLPADYQKIEVIALDDDFSLPESLMKIKTVNKDNIVKYHNVIDYDTLIEKTIGNKIDMILDALDIDFNFITSKIKAKNVRKL